LTEADLSSVALPVGGRDHLYLLDGHNPRLRLDHFDYREEAGSGTRVRKADNRSFQLRLFLVRWKLAARPRQENVRYSKAHLITRPRNAPPCYSAIGPDRDPEIGMRTIKTNSSGMQTREDQPVAAGWSLKEARELAIFWTAGGNGETDVPANIW
jgi:hypothetical protein